MNEPLFIETIKMIDGQPVNLPAHISRMQQTLHEIYGSCPPLPLAGLAVPAEQKQGIVKCRVEYGRDTLNISFAPYQPRTIRTLKTVECQEIDYHLKYADRSSLTRLLAQKEDCDDILITQNGRITDTSYSNVVLFDGYDFLTPSAFLLNGTKRQALLHHNTIREANLTILDLKHFKRLYLINAMLDIGDVSVEIENIFISP